MVKCQILRGVPGSGDDSAQPFSVSITPAAELLMDFHAHLITDEIIGYLGRHGRPAHVHNDRNRTYSIHVCFVLCQAVTMIMNEDTSASVKLFLGVKCRLPMTVSTLKWILSRR